MKSYWWNLLMKLLALEKSATSATKGEQTQLFPLNPLQLTTIPPILISYTTFKALRSRTMMSTPLLLASLVFTAHEASAFLGIAPTRAGLFLPTSGSKIGTRVARSSRIAMTSTTSPQPERSSKEWGDFESWFWGDPHVRGGVEHAVFKRSNSAVALFDGECNFCNSGIWIILANSNERNMRFCAQNTEMGHSLLASFGQDQERLSSIALMDKSGHLFTHSDAVIQILLRMDAPYSALGYLLACVPLNIRDTVYAWVSDHRHEFLPENVVCRIPEDDEVSRFIM